MADFKTRKCPICENANRDLIVWVESVGKVERIKCRSCETIYFDRTPPTPPVYDLDYNVFFNRPGDIRKAGIMAAKLAELAKTFFKNPRILEAGSGNGLTVFLLRAMGLDAYGLDLDPALTKMLYLDYNIPTYTSRFEEFCPADKFDLIYSSHVIEHTADPHAYMRKAADILSDKGILYLDTPDTHYAGKEAGRWHHYATRNQYEHCCLLGTPGINILAQRAGFDVLRVERYDKYQSTQVILSKAVKTTL